MAEGIRDLLFSKTSSAPIQFVRYAFVGGLAAAVDAGSLYALHAHWGWNHLTAAAAGFLLGMLANYLISVAWVFESSGKIGAEMALFAAIGIGGLGWTELILWAGVDLAHAPLPAAKAVALLLVLAWNFGMRRKFVFKAAGAARSEAAGAGQVI